jgi:hypothetical protein
MQLPKLPDLEELHKKLMRERELMLLTLIEEERLQSVQQLVPGMRLPEMRLRLRLHGMRPRLRLRPKEHTKLRRTQRRLMQHAKPGPTLTPLLVRRQGVQGVLRVLTRLGMLGMLQPGPRPRRMLEKLKMKNYQKLQTTYPEVLLQL